MPDEEPTESQQADDNPPVTLRVSLDGETEGLAERCLETEYIGRWLAIRIADALSTYVEIDGVHRIDVASEGRSVNVSLAEYVRQALLLRSTDAVFAEDGSGHIRISCSEVQNLVDRLLENPDAKAQCVDFSRALPRAEIGDSTDFDDVPSDEGEAFMREQLALSQYVIEKMRQLLWVEVGEYGLSKQWQEIRAFLGGPYTGACIARIGDVLTQLIEKKRVHIDVNALRRDAHNLLMSVLAVDDDSSSAGEGAGDAE